MGLFRDNETNKFKWKNNKVKNPNEANQLAIYKQLYNYYLRKADKLDLKDSNELDDTMASGRQFQSAIFLGKYENLEISLFAYGTRNLN